MRLKLLAGVALALGVMVAGAASAQVVGAAGSGWITAGGDTNNGPFADGNVNTFTGFEGSPDQTYYDWFKFDLPSGTVGSATLSIWNDGNNSTNDPGAEYTVHAPSDFSFTGLGAGPSFGSVLFGVADTGVSHYVDIVLNGAGVAYVNSHLGGEITFGGAFTSSTDPTGCNDCVSMFGFTGGSPAATLTLGAGGSAAPEPSS